MEGLVFLTALLAELDCSIGTHHQVHVECKEQRDEQRDRHRQNIRCDNEVSDFVVEAAWVVYRALQDRVRGANDGPDGGHAVEHHTQEVLVVVESHTVGYPRAVVVHLQDASVALRAVVASIRLGFVAPLADANTAKAFLLDADHHLLAFLVE